MKQEIVNEYQDLVRQRVTDLKNDLSAKLAHLKQDWEAQGKLRSGKFIKEMVQAHTDLLGSTLKAVFSTTTEIMVKYDLELDYVFKSKLVKLLDETFYSLSDTIEERIRSNIFLFGDNSLGVVDFAAALRTDITKIKTWYNNRIITYSFEIGNRVGKK